MSVESELQRAFSLIRQLQGALGGMTIRVGTIGAVAAGTTKIITHGLVNADGTGRVPSGVFTQASNAGIDFGVDLVNDTTFRVANGSATNTDGYWVIFG